MNLFEKFLIGVLIVIGLFLVDQRVNAAPAAAPSPLVYVVGEVSGNVLTKLEPYLASTVSKKLPKLHIVINSPGGSVLTGTIFIRGMEILKARGTKIVCYVPTLAASMAFQMLAHCDDRIALEGAFLLWHPVRAGVMANLTPHMADQIARDLARIETQLITDLRSRLPIDDDTFNYHYYAETLHAAEELNPLLRRTLNGPWIDIVDNLPWVNTLLPVDKEAKPFGDRPFGLRYIMPGWK